MPRRKRPAPGSVVEIPLPNGRWAYGRVLKDGCLAVYKQLSDQPNQPPVGKRDYMFVVGVYDDVLKKKWPVIAFDPSGDPGEDWPPPMKVVDVITGVVEEYHKGQ